MSEFQKHPYMKRYRDVWEQTLSQGSLPIDQIEKSRYYFEEDLTNPTPKMFTTNTFGIAALLPMPVDSQTIFTDLWDQVMHSLDHPVAYSVEPQNRHVELLVFTRPEEVISEDVVQKNINTSYRAMKKSPPAAFTITYCHPFITPDGTIVVPGFPQPVTAVDEFRSKINALTDGTLPVKQSQWFHTPLGRILEPLDSARLEHAFHSMETSWGEPIVSLEINELLWTSEKQWYMVQKEIIHRLGLS